MTVYIAYTHISSSNHNGKTVLDGDTDLETLRRRVNAYMASPKMVNYNRGVAHEIPHGELKSRDYHGNGGGCHYTAWLSIQELKPLPVDDFIPTTYITTVDINLKETPEELETLESIQLEIDRHSHPQGL